MAKFKLSNKTKKLIIYNARSKQSEVFTGVEGQQLHPVVSPSRPTSDYYDECGLLRRMDECETHLSLVVDKPAIL